jgi:exodeoxyribonuclease VII large subunit
MTPESFTLSSLNLHIRDAMQEAFPDAVWVVAEIHEMQINRSGHCYMELIEKAESDNNIIAKSRATIWSFKFRMLRPYFESTSGTQLQPGIKVLLKAEVSFHPVYGLSLNISDIDPSYTMGDLAMKKREVIRQLQEAGIMEMNRELTLAEVPQHIAVISSETAAGYGDFIGTLVNNSYGFAFSVTLFPAIMQGEAAEQSIIAAMERVFLAERSFDVAVLIRGGGSQADLDCFNGYELAMNIAQFPIPVLTGIGHERDETIADMVAHMHLKTPTAVAEFLIDRLQGFSDRLNRLKERFTYAVQRIMQQENHALGQKASDIQHLARQYVTRENHALEVYRTGIFTSVAKLLKAASTTITNQSGRMKYLWKNLHDHRQRDLLNMKERHHRAIAERLRAGHEQIRQAERSLEFLRPEKILSRGYSITYHNGKIVKSVGELQKEEVMETRMSDGNVISTVRDIKHTQEK